MRTLRAMALIPVLGLALVACGSDSAKTPDTTAASSSTAAAPETTADSTGSTAGGTDTTTAGTDGPVQSGPVQIDVVVGTDSGPDRIEKLAVGSQVTLNITNPNSDDEFHVHDPVDLEKKAAKGEMVTFNFTVDAPGEIEVESHVTEDVYLVLQVG